MEEKMTSNSNLYHQNNFKCKSYWLFKDGEKVLSEEPEQRTAQYEIDVKDEGYGKKLCISIFSRVGLDPAHKRDYYNYFEVPFDSTFAKSLYEFLKQSYAVNDSMVDDVDMGD